MTERCVIVAALQRTNLRAPESSLQDKQSIAKGGGLHVSLTNESPEHLSISYL